MAIIRAHLSDEPRHTISHALTIDLFPKQPTKQKEPSMFTLAKKDGAKDDGVLGLDDLKRLAQAISKQTGTPAAPVLKVIAQFFKLPMDTRFVNADDGGDVQADSGDVSAGGPSKLDDLARKMASALGLDASASLQDVLAAMKAAVRQYESQPTIADDGDATTADDGDVAAERALKYAYSIGVDRNLAKRCIELSRRNGRTSARELNE